MRNLIPGCKWITIAAVAVSSAFVCPPGWADDPDPLVRLSVREGSDKPITLSGKIVVQALDGGILLLDREGRLWPVPPKKLVRRQDTSEPFTRVSADEQAQALADELGPGFEMIRTRHYVIATSTGLEYAEWCGELFERLLDAFMAHWRNLGVEVSEPAWPLPAIIFADHKEFKSHAAGDDGKVAEESRGYYSVRTNRIMLYDLTAGLFKKRATTKSEIKRRLAAATFNLATIVHEATHQIAFNSGLHTRFADNPLWFTEGLAMYFETPDLDGGRDWKTIGQINHVRADRFLEFLKRRRRRDSLTTLVSQIDRFKDTRKAADAYAEAWALTYFLNETHRPEYVEFVKRVAQKRPLMLENDSARLAEFKAVFGDPGALDEEFVQFMKALPKH